MKNINEMRKEKNINIDNFYSKNKITYIKENEFPQRENVKNLTNIFENKIKNEQKEQGKNIL